MRPQRIAAEYPILKQGAASIRSRFNEAAANRCGIQLLGRDDPRIVYALQ